MRAEEEEEKINRTRGGVVEGEDNLTGFIDRLKVGKYNASSG